MRKIFSWVGVLFLVTLAVFTWLFFFRSSSSLDPAQAPPLACNKGNPQEARGPQIIIVFFLEGCAKQTKDGAATARNQGQTAASNLEKIGVTSLRYPVTIDFWPEEKWQVWTKQRSAGAARVPVRAKDRIFYISSALSSIALRESFPGLQDNRALAEGYALLSLGNPFYPASAQGQNIYRALQKDRQMVEKRLGVCRERECSLGELL